MEIKNKDLLKIHIKDKIEKYIKEFPIYFYGNIFINIILIVSIVFAAMLSAISLRVDATFTLYGVAFMVAAISILKTTTKNFLRNVRIIKNIQEGNYKFGIEDYEMDNTIELIEDLPKSKQEIKDLKVSLSFDKLIEVLVAARIIKYYKGMYDLDLKFKYKYEIALEENQIVIE